MEQKRT
jgi:mitogen-activated protein kinase 1/3